MSESGEYSQKTPLKNEQTYNITQEEVSQSYHNMKNAQQKLNKSQEKQVVYSSQGSASRYEEQRPSSKDQYRMLMQGISSVLANDGAIQTDMMKAIVHQKKSQDEHLQIRARIIKLQKEDEKANKRIGDLQRRQKFIQDINNVKNEKIQMIRNHIQNKKLQEEFNREIINNARAESQNRIYESLQKTHLRNKSQFLTTKDQQKKIEFIVSKNNDYLVKEKKKAFLDVKQYENKVKQNEQNNKQRNYEFIKKEYEQRIKQRYDESNEIKQKARQLEKEEEAILNKLQKTFQMEKKLYNQLILINKESPIVQRDHPQ